MKKKVDLWIIGWLCHFLDRVLLASCYCAYYKPMMRARQKNINRLDKELHENPPELEEYAPMKVKIEPQETALLVIDVQNDLVEEKGAFAKMPGGTLWKVVKEDKVIEKIERGIEASRKAGIPIFHIKTVHRKDLADVRDTITDWSLSGLSTPVKEREPQMLIEGTWGSDLVDDVKSEPEDYIIEKRSRNAFLNTSLEMLLRARDVRTLIVMGVVTEGCVDATVSDARDRGFNIIVIIDCVATIERKIQDFWLKNIFPKKAVTMTVDELTEALD